MKKKSGTARAIRAQSGEHGPRDAATCAGHGDLLAAARRGTGLGVSCGVVSHTAKFTVPPGGAGLRPRRIAHPFLGSLALKWHRWAATDGAAGTKTQRVKSGGYYAAARSGGVRCNLQRCRRGHGRCEEMQPAAPPSSDQQSQSGALCDRCRGQGSRAAVLVHRMQRARAWHELHALFGAVGGFAVQWTRRCLTHPQLFACFALAVCRW